MEAAQQGKSSSLTSVFKEIEGWKAHKTLRSVERAPTISAIRNNCEPDPMVSLVKVFAFVFA
jgi:hypothetical protein